MISDLDSYKVARLMITRYGARWHGSSDLITAR